MLSECGFKSFPAPIFSALIFNSISFKFYEKKVSTVILNNSFRAPEFIPLFRGVRVTRSLVLGLGFVDRCLSFCLFSFGKVLSFCIRITDSDYPVSSNSSYINKTNIHLSHIHLMCCFLFGFSYSLQKGWTSAVSCYWILYSSCVRQVASFGY